MTTNTEETPISAISLKLANFWPKSPAVWFAQAEGQFAIRNITVDTTKYSYVLSSLDQATAQRIQDLLVNPPAHGKYEAIKGSSHVQRRRRESGI